MRLKDIKALPKGPTHSITIDVRFSEVDSLHIVWHGNYIKYMEDGREAFGRMYGISYLDIKKKGYTIPIVKINCEYKKPLKYGEKATINTTFIHTDAAKIIFLTEIFNEAMELVACGETIQIFMDDQNELCLEVPEFYHQWKKQL